MAKNVEIKCRVRDRDTLEKQAAVLADHGPELLLQVDQFFHLPVGRLKLRTINQTQSELIFYRRPNSAGPKVSEYRRVPVEHTEALAQLLTDSLGVIATISKRRTLYLIGQTRIHLDQVENLGDFLELEVVLAPDQDVRHGEQIANSLCQKLGVSESDLVELAYIDLLCALEENGERQR